MLKNGVVNSLNSEITFDIKQVYLNFIDTLTLHHLEVLKFISEFEDRIKTVNEYQKIYDIMTQDTIDQDIPRLTKMEITTFRFLLKDLEAKGLVYISDDMGDIEHIVHGNSSISMNFEDMEELPFIRITEFGGNFLKFVIDNQ
jgi:hypothetical protein